MEDSTERLFYLGAGPMTAILLGALLVPLRDFTTASNFTFVFLALTIVVAELGGRWPAVATALGSALSLDFFLTQPYMRLAIEGKNDVIAFVGLAACGLLVAVLGSQRAERIGALAGARKQLELVHASLLQAERGGSLEWRLGNVLNACRAALPVTAAVVRDEHDHVVAASERGHAMLPVPAQILQPDTLLPSGDAGPALSRRSVALPLEGGRLALRVGERQVGWLDLWGSGLPVSGEARQALSDVARLLALLLASPPRPEEQTGSPSMSRQRA